MNNKILSLLLPVVALFLLLTILYGLSGADLGASDAPLRFLAALIGALGMGVVFYLTRESQAWAISLREIINGFAGAMLYAVFAWFFSGAMFVAPAAGDLGLRPAVVFPVIFGYLFGPVTGFIAGGFGSLFGNLLAGTAISPEWDMAVGLVGFVAGMHVLFPNRARALEVATWLAGGIGLLGTLAYVLNTTVQNQFASAPITPWLGYSVLGGAVVCLAIRYAFPDETWSEVVVWGALANVVGLGLAALSDIWIEAGRLSPAEAAVGRFVPAAGPNLVAVAILIPFLIALYTEMKAREAA